MNTHQPNQSEQAHRHPLCHAAAYRRLRSIVFLMLCLSSLQGAWGQASPSFGPGGIIVGDSLYRFGNSGNAASQDGDFYYYRPGVPGSVSYFLASDGTTTTLYSYSNEEGLGAEGLAVWDGTAFDANSGYSACRCRIGNWASINIDQDHKA